MGLLCPELVPAKVNLLQLIPHQNNLLHICNGTVVPFTKAGFTSLSAHILQQGMWILGKTCELGLIRVAYLHISSKLFHFFPYFSFLLCDIFPNLMPP
jgi:hypothetical protein